MRLQSKLLILATILLFSLTFIGGCEYGKGRVHCKEITTDTITHIDTITHEISSSYPYYVDKPVIVIKHDTVLTKVDTAKILEDYFSLHVYQRKWENDTLLVNVKDTITMNRSIGNEFTYKIKTPFTTIVNKQDNSITYNKYFSVGVSIPVSNIKYSELYGIYHFPKGFFGVGYSSELKSFTLHAGATIFKIK